MKACYLNILETSTVSLAQGYGTEDPSYPLYRLYDRNIGRPFKTTAAVTTQIKCDQGASGNLTVDRLLIPAGHNLGGLTLAVLYSDNGADWSYAATDWTAGSGVIDKSWAAATRRWWLVSINAPTAPPSIPELFLTQTYEWERNPRRPGGPFDPRFNVERAESFGGQVRFLVRGDSRRQRVYHVSMAGETQKSNIAALNDVWKGACPFWLYDHEGVWLFGELRREITLMEIAYQRYDFEFDFLEVLP